ncbi:MAG: tRNA 2-thiocytidine biosynthesis TtcA family protein [Clostridia bacterium]|nr:tRNA 2-thiocytidine biosynthesis TtcA family protein [Clostridia bacterium]
MARKLEAWQIAERSLIKKYRKELWNPFIAAVKRYELIQAGDRIAVCISGGKDSMLLAMLMRHLQAFSEVPFELVYLCMDPGYSPENRAQIESNARLLNIPIEFFETNVFASAEEAGGESPCYICARMRRGNLYAEAKARGCNKIALGHHLNDVIETALMSMTYGAQLQGMVPKLNSANFAGMQLIRPLYCISERDIIAWQRYNDLTFLRCACRFSESAAADTGASKRQETKHLIAELRKINPNVEINLFSSLHKVNLDTLPGYKHNGQIHSFLENMSPKDTED